MEMTRMQPSNNKPYPAGTQPQMAAGSLAALLLRRSGFTLLELLSVLLIIGVIISIAFGAFVQARTTAWKQKARDSARQIATAWSTRLVENRAFPSASAFTADPVYDTDPNSFTFETTTNNMAVLNYIDQNAEQRLNGMKDKWGRFFHVRLDTNYDGTVLSPLDASLIRANVLVWSLGPTPLYPSNSWIMVWPQ